MTTEAVKKTGYSTVDSVHLAAGGVTFEPRLEAHVKCWRLSGMSHPGVAEIWGSMQASLC